MKIYLDNNLIQFPGDSLLKPKFSIRRSSESSSAAVSFTGTLTFTHADYDYVYGKLVIDPNAINNSIILKFVDDCCGDKEYFFIIKPESLRWCNGSCQIDANALEYSLDSQAYACINNTLIWDDYNGFQQRIHPRVQYCLEFRPSILQDALLIFGLLTVSMSASFLPVLLIVQTIVNTINVVIDAVNALGGNLNKISFNGDTSNTSIFQWALDLGNNIAEFVVGCNYDHPSPYVRSYIQNVCLKCGIGFQSSILNDQTNEYFKLVYFSAQVRKGQSAGQYFGGLVGLIQRNKPIHNGKSFLDEIKIPFNAKWDIHNNVLRFERRDWFQNQSPWLDLTTYDPKKIISVCYEWTKKPRPAYAEIGYSKDAMDWVGQEALSRWSDTIEWNVPVNPLQKGAFTVTFPFGAARFRGDGIDRDVLADYEWMPFGIGDAIKANTDVMLLNNGTAFLPKLLILRDGTPTLDALIENKYTSYSDSKDPSRDDQASSNQSYNSPMWVREGISYGQSNLYDRFWYIENPRYAKWSGYDVVITLVWDCAILNAVNIDGTVLVDKGLVKVETVDLDFSTGIMVIKGTV